jgi:hypothetical protein
VGRAALLGFDGLASPSAADQRDSDLLAIRAFAIASDLNTTNTTIPVRPCRWPVRVESSRSTSDQHHLLRPDHVSSRTQYATTRTANHEHPRHTRRPGSALAQSCSPYPHKPAGVFRSVSRLDDHPSIGYWAALVDCSGKRMGAGKWREGEFVSNTRGTRPDPGSCYASMTL